MFLSVVIAIYNEEGNVIELTKRIYSSLEKLNIPFELIYVIDGEDKSYEILKDIKEKKNNLILNHSLKLRGFKNAFVQGFKLMDLRTTHVLTLDGDLNHQPEEFFKFLDKMKRNDSDIVIGSRYIEGGKVEKLMLWKRAVSNIMVLEQGEFIV